MDQPTFADPRSWSRAGSALRIRPGPAVRRAEAHGSPARRDHDSALPSSAGKAQPRAGHPGGNQRSSGIAGTEAAGGNHRGRQHHRGPVDDQEPDRGARLGDTPDQEGEPVASFRRWHIRVRCFCGGQVHGLLPQGQAIPKAAPQLGVALPL